MVVLMYGVPGMISSIGFKLFHLQSWCLRTWPAKLHFSLVTFWVTSSMLVLPQIHVLLLLVSRIQSIDPSIAL